MTFKNSSGKKSPLNLNRILLRVSTATNKTIARVGETIGLSLSLKKMILLPVTKEMKKTDFFT